MHQIRFRLGVRPRSCLQRFTRPPIAEFKGSTSKGKEGKGRRGRGGIGEGRWCDATLLDYELAFPHLPSPSPPFLFLPPRREAPPLGVGTSARTHNTITQLYWNQIYMNNYHDT